MLMLYLYDANDAGSGQSRPSLRPKFFVKSFLLLILYPVKKNALNKYKLNELFWCLIKNNMVNMSGVK